jgi:hypothetical protein
MLFTVVPGWANLRSFPQLHSVLSVAPGLENTWRAPFTASVAAATIREGARTEEVEGDVQGLRPWSFLVVESEWLRR